MTQGEGKYIKTDHTPCVYYIHVCDLLHDATYKYMSRSSYFHPTTDMPFRQKGSLVHLLQMLGPNIVSMTCQVHPLILMVM